MKNFVQPGNTLTFTNGTGAALASGEGVLLGTTGLFGVCAGAIAIAAIGEASVNGVFNLPKATADTPAEFANAYWDNTAKEITTVSTANTLVGVFAAAYGAGVLLADIKLVPGIA